MKMVKCLPQFEYLTVFLKSRNFISKIRNSKVTDYAALNLELHVNMSRHESNTRFPPPLFEL